MGKQIIRVANIIEEGRLGGPQIRIAEVVSALKQLCQREGMGTGRGDIEKESAEKESCIGYVNVETTVMFPKYESEEFRKRLDKYSASYLCLPLHRLSMNWKYLLKYILWFPMEIILVWWVLRKYNFDVVHVSGGSWQVKGVVAGKLAGCRVIWHLNDTSMSGPVRMFFCLMVRWGADGLIVAGRRVRHYYVKDLGLGKSKPVFEIQAPVDCACFNPQAVTPDSKIAEGDALKVVSVSNINPLKGIEYFLYMADLLNQKYRGELQFFIVGQQWASQRTYSRRLEKIQEAKKLDNVTFFGQSSDVRRIHKAADIYVCSSVAEASPLSVWEAMAMKQAIVATDVGDVSRFITHGSNGYIVPPGDSEKLAHYVGILVDNPDLRKQFGENARRVACDRLDLANIAKQHVDAYYSVCKAGKGVDSDV